MKNTIIMLFFGLFFLGGLSAQPKKFLRIFDLSGKKIASGYLNSTSDSSIILVHDPTALEFSVSKIGYIKTKRSGGHTILIASAAGGVSVGLLALAVNSGDEGDSWFQFSSGEAFFGGLIYGAAMGAITGGIVSAANKRIVYQINGEAKKWLEAKVALEK